MKCDLFLEDVEGDVVVAAALVGQEVEVLDARRRHELLQPAQPYLDAVTLAALELRQQLEDVARILTPAKARGIPCKLLKITQKTRNIMVRFLSSRNGGT